jgi:Fe2+ or Zn2+ uptake regulation protein
VVTVHDEYTTEEQRSVVLFFLLAKRLNAKDIHKEMFHAYGGKYLSRKTVYNWVEKFSQRRSKVAEDET